MAEMKFTTGPKGTGTQVNPKKVGLWVLIGVIILLVLTLIFNTFTVVNEGYIGVKYRFGKIVRDDLKAGLNLSLPFIEEIKQVDIREQVFELDTNAYTSDTQTVEALKLKLNYVYDSAELSSIIKEVGIENVTARLIYPQVNAIAKNEIGTIKAENLVNTRMNVQQSIQEKLTESLAKNGIVVTNFAIENLEFENVFEEAVRAKVVAQQDALKAQNKTEEIKQEAEQTRISAQAQADSALIRAEADAKSISLIQEQIAKNPLYVEYLKATKWNGELPQAMGTEVNPFISFGTDTQVQTP